jgi:hypothetical protein
MDLLAQAMALGSLVRRSEDPPGKTTRSGAGASSKVNSGRIFTKPWLTSGSFEAATVYTRKAGVSPARPKPAAALKTSEGPAKSRISTPS